MQNEGSLERVIVEKRWKTNKEQETLHSSTLLGAAAYGQYLAETNSGGKMSIGCGHPMFELSQDPVAALQIFNIRGVHINLPFLSISKIDL